MSLSDKITHVGCETRCGVCSAMVRMRHGRQFLRFEDVQEAVRELKNEIKTMRKRGEQLAYYDWLNEKIDEIFGEKLI